MKDKYQFIVDFAVRDYECDMYGVVNNAVYQNYLEHARNENLKAVGLNFTAMAQEGQRIFVSKITLHYKQALMSNDRFFVGINAVRPNNFALNVQQDIYRYKTGLDLPENTAIVEGQLVMIGMIGKSFALPKAIIEAYPLTVNTTSRGV